MLNLYTKIHKAQRAWLERALVAAGRIEASDAAAAAALSADAVTLVNHLRAHAEHEDHFIDPVLRAVAPRLAERLEDEHRALDPALDRIALSAQRGDIAHMYRNLSLLTAQYFFHLDVEEQEAMPLLAAAYDEDALRSRILRPFVASRTSDEMLQDLRLQLLAVNPQEASELLAAVTSH